MADSIELARSPAAPREGDKEEVDARVQFLARILSELEAEGCDYALIHGDPNAWPDVSSDVDIAFGAPPPLSVEPILARLTSQSEWILVERLHYEVARGYYYVLCLPTERACFLHLDCLYDPLGLNRYHLSTSLLLAEATAGRFGRSTSKRTQALYLLMKRAVKGKATFEELGILRAQFVDASDSLWADVEEWFGSESKGQVERLLQSQNLEEAGERLRSLAKQAERVFRRRHPALVCRRWLADSVRKLKRFVQPTGLFVVVLGPDGSGKSTVTGLVLAQMERAFRRTWRFHWRPGLLPQLGRHNASASGDVQPSLEFKHGRIVSLLRFGYYWLDFVLGYWLIIYPRKARTTLVLGERYFPDVIVHPERYGFNIPRWLMRLAARFVPAPDLLMVLWDDPERIYARKPELPIPTIAHQIKSYTDEAPNWGAHRLVQTVGDADDVADHLSGLILSQCARRTQRRLGMASGTGLRAFPSARSVKVWFDDEESLATALNLYHPYSFTGRLAKTCSQFAPRSFYPLLFRDRPDPYEAARLDRLADTVRSTLATPGLSVSFYSGARGVHQKFTAQASRAGTVVSFVKIAADERVAALLQREADVLSWLRQSSFTTAALPAVLAHERCREHTLLFLGPPPGGEWRPRGHPIDHDDVRFLLALQSLGSGVANVDDVLKHINLEAYLRTIAAVDRPAADVVHNAAANIRHWAGNTGVKVNTSHGDFAPWNSFELGDGRMFVFDWEYGARQGLALSDAYHRIFSTLRLVKHEAAEVAVDRLMQIPNDPMLGRVVAASGVDRKDLPMYVLLYLVEQLAMRPTDDVRPDPFLVEALRYAHSIVTTKCERGR